MKRQRRRTVYLKVLCLMNFLVQILTCFNTFRCFSALCMLKELYSWMPMAVTCSIKSSLMSKSTIMSLCSQCQASYTQKASMFACFIFTSNQCAISHLDRYILQLLHVKTLTARKKVND